MVTLAVGHNLRSRVISLSFDVFRGGRSESQVLLTRGEGILAGWGSLRVSLTTAFRVHP